MSSLDAFVAFAESGIWSESNQFVNTPSNDQLQAALRVYIFSEMLRQNGWSAVHISTLNEPPLDNLRDFANLCRDPNLVENYNISASYCNAKGVKGRSLYLSPETGKVYRLDYKGKRKNKKVEPMELLRRINDRKWSNLPSLFDGSWNCTQKGLAGGAVVNQLVSVFSHRFNSPIVNVPLRSASEDQQRDSYGDPGYELYLQAPYLPPL